MADVGDELRAELVEPALLGRGVDQEQHAEQDDREREADEPDLRHEAAAPPRGEAARPKNGRAIMQLCPNCQKLTTPALRAGQFSSPLQIPPLKDPIKRARWSKFPPL